MLQFSYNFSIRPSRYCTFLIEKYANGISDLRFFSSFLGSFHCISIVSSFILHSRTLSYPRDILQISISSPAISSSLVFSIRTSSLSSHNKIHKCFIIQYDSSIIPNNVYYVPYLFLPSVMLPVSTSSLISLNYHDLSPYPGFINRGLKCCSDFSSVRHKSSTVVVSPFR